jgi:protein-tyrosine phosphatase
LNIDIATLKQVIAEEGLHYQQVSMGDFGADFEQFMAVSDILDKSIREHGLTYIHCTAGVGRSPTSILLYLCRFHSMT